jgi:uncharacterized RDD family membrane protein YckC
MQTCAKCGQQGEDSARYCVACGAEFLSHPQPAVSYPRPAGFWIRAVARVVDNLIFIPLIGLLIYNLLVIKSSLLMFLIAIPDFFYKPLMESYYGATLGKMACGIQVMDAKGQKLSLSVAYMRCIPFLISNVVTLIGALITFSSPGFSFASTLAEIARVEETNPVEHFETIINLLLLVDCIVAGFTYRKRAVHDMMAGSYCVYKEPCTEGDMARGT